MITLEVNENSNTLSKILTRLLIFKVRKMMDFFRQKVPPGAAHDRFHIPDNLSAYDPFRFWAGVNGENLKSIRHLPMILLSIPATSAPSERVFSSAGYIVDKNRNRLLETNVTMLTVVRDHLIRLNDIPAFYQQCAKNLKEIK